MFFKVLNADGTSCNSGNAQWSLPVQNADGTWTPGDWMPAIEGELIPCENGYHLAEDAQVLEWLGPLLPLKNAVDLVMRLLRDSGHKSHHTASQGLFQLMLGGRGAHLLRLALDSGCTPEVSANKYAVNIRFLVPDRTQKPRPCDRDVDFDLIFCNL